MKSFLHKLWHFRLIILISLAIIGSIGATAVIAQNQQVVVQADVLNIRKGPGLAYNVSAQVNKGERLTVISDQNGWYQVRLGSTKVGWVAGWLIKNTEVSATSNQIGVIKTADTPLYATNTDNSTQLKTLSLGTKVTILYHEDGWYQLEYQDSVAWVNEDDIKLTHEVADNAKTTPTPKADTKTGDQIVVTSTDNTAIRTEPNTNADVITKVKKDSQLTYLKAVNKWYQVKLADGQTGYVASWIVALADKKTQEDTMPKIASNLAEATIVLDPGHGGDDVGASSIKGQYEKIYTLKMAQRIAAKLKAAGANVVLTRTSDSTVGLAARANAANHIKADAFISIHFDSTEVANTGSGLTTYYYHKNRDQKLAQMLSQQFDGLPLTNRAVEFGNYQVLRDNQRPATLLELGYINTKKDFKQIKQRRYQDKVASAVVTALTNYFK